ncbi:hypothetical protein ANAPC5_00039 [Anaplasma phagocytophilum]|nr:hypothetical protein ANAPC2_00273 [Anaplasma phagocytophilum]SBO32328.1 hypothetical protein ANAPC3_00826 [Anaplasma phagocytophilum]SBO32389.1 hypothetical protein ANAPC4_00793 [Anaplasma phagocytophilum]SBO32633.1 hypothetical protein ANAPC4_00877 [Anaplasma phagocytophilum]SCV61651.1 hypothetical protein ANAPC5_00039 [Anaplasma phagocytophilum]
MGFAAGYTMIKGEIGFAHWVALCVYMRGHKCCGVSFAILC